MHHFVLPKLRLVFSQPTCPIHFFRPKTKFLGGFARFRCREVQVVRSGFGCIKCTTLCFRSCVLFFRNELAQSTSLGPKLCVLGGFARFRCREVPIVRSGFGVHTMHHFILPKLRLVFWQPTCKIHFFWPKTKFLAGFTRFRCREVQVVRSGFGVHNMHHFVLPKLRLVFSQRICPIHFFRQKN